MKTLRSLSGKKLDTLELRVKANFFRTTRRTEYDRIYAMLGKITDEKLRRMGL